MIKLFIGSIAWATTEEGLRAHFEQFGEVTEAIILKDKFTGRSRGFGFVSFANREDGEKAIAELNGKDLDGRELVVNEARPREERNDQF